MATTDEEWERLFRQRLEHYESEPDEDALEQILSDVKPMPVAKPSGRWGRRIGAGLSVLAVLLLGLWQSKSSLTEKPRPVAAVARTNAVPKPLPIPLRDQRSEVETEERLVKSSPSAGQNSLEQPNAKAVLTAGNTLPRATRQRADQKRVAAPKLSETDLATGFTAYHSAVGLSAAAEPTGRPLHFNPITSKAIRFALPGTVLPHVPVIVARPTPAIEPTRSRVKPSFFANAMPLYTFRQLTPSRQDEIVMEKIRPATSLAARTGWRVQAGAEWALSRTVGLRVGVVYQQLQQQLTYTARAVRSDSSKVEWVDPQTIKLTPLYKSQDHAVKTTWRYVALSAEGRLRLNPGQEGLRHYVSAGGSLGYLIGGRSRQNWQPFLQASYGIERWLTKQLRLQIEPGVVYNMRSISDNSQCFKVKPYSYGLVVGLRWQPGI